MEDRSDPTVESPRPATEVVDRPPDQARGPRGGLVGLLLSDKKFAVALVGITSSIVALSLGLPKIWVITPEGFSPVLRVSLLDMVQAQMLARSARRLNSEGRPKEAMQAWAGALGNHPARVENIRSFVEFVLNREGLERRWLTIGAQQSQWLVSLVGTNDFQAVELAGRSCLKAGMNEMAWLYLNNTNRSLSSPAAKALAEAAFKTGRLKQFASTWESRREEMQSDPALALYWAAWRALAGKPAEQVPSMAILDQAAGVPELKVLAIRLRSIVEAERLDLEAFERSFEELRSIRQDDLEDHTRAWMVLEAAGKHAVAVARATAYAIPPETGEQAAQLLRSWMQLRLEKLAPSFSRNLLDSFAGDPNVWFLISQMLVVGQEWDEVRSVAARIRFNPTLARIFAGYADYLEGVAENATGRLERARGLFESLLTHLPQEPSLGMDAANTLERIGYRTEARDILQRLESTFGNSPQYWFSLGRLAWEQRDAAALLKAAEKAYALQPTSLDNINNLAAALLVNRVRPTEAVQLTLEVLRRAAYQHGALLNHAFALIRNGRNADARKILDDLPLSALTNEERTFWRLASAELELSEGNQSAVAKHLPDIDHQFLYPSQTKWVEEIAKQMVAPKP